MPRQSGPITAAEVRRWLDRFSQELDSDVYQSVTDHFQYMAERRNGPKKKPSHELVDDTIVWDFKDVSKAAKIVLANIPIMLSSWERMLPTSETRAGYEAIRVLGELLSSAMPYVEYPWGYYEGSRRHPPKDWHLPAVLIANTITHALVKSGHKRPAMSSGNTILAQVIQTVLERMGHKNNRNRRDRPASAPLVRAGWRPQQLRMTTNRAGWICG